MDKRDLEMLYQNVPDVVHERLVKVVEVQTSGKCNHMKNVSYRKVLIIGLAATFLLGTTVFADDIYKIYVERYAYKTEIKQETASIEDVESTETVMADEFAGFDYIRLAFGYLPEGFTSDREEEMMKLESMGLLDPEYEPDGETKYHNVAGESIMPMIMKMDSGKTIAEVRNTKDVRELTFAGKKAFIISQHSVKESGYKKCYVFFDDSVYYVYFNISSGISDEDVEIILENCSLEGCNEKWIEQAHIQSVAEIDADSRKTNQQVSSNQQSSAQSAYTNRDWTEMFDDFSGVGDTIECSGRKFTLNSYEIIDNISGYDKNKFVFDLDENYFDEAGNVKSRHIQIIKPGDGITSVDEVVEERDVPVKLLKVNLTVKVTEDVDRFGVYVTPFLVWDGLSKSYLPDGTYEIGMRREEFPIYNEIATDNKKGITYAWLNKGDEVSYDLIYIVDEDYINHIGLSFITSPDSNTVKKQSFDLRL